MKRDFQIKVWQNSPNSQTSIHKILRAVESVPRYLTSYMRLLSVAVLDGD